MNGPVLDLFSGLGGWAEGFRTAGFDVTTLDIEPKFGCDITADVRDWIPDKDYRVVVASPPCEHFSTLTFQRGYFKKTPGFFPVPNSPQADLALDLVAHTWDIIRALEPAYFVIENPRALLRQVMGQTWPLDHTRSTVWYCHYGLPVAKPTDLWHSSDLPWQPKPKCHNRRPNHPEDCCCHDHVAAPRGSRSGTQGPQNAAERAKVPFHLSFDIAKAVASA